MRAGLGLQSVDVNAPKQRCVGARGVKSAHDINMGYTQSTQSLPVWSGAFWESVKLARGTPLPRCVDASANASGSMRASRARQRIAYHSQRSHRTSRGR